MEPWNSEASPVPRQLFFQMPAETSRPSALVPRFQRFPLRWFFVTAFLFGVAGFFAAWWVRPYSAKTILLVRESAFTSVTEAREFAGTLASPSSLDRLSRRFSPPILPQRLADICRFNFDAANSSLVLSARADDARFVRVVADGLAAHAVGCAGEWVTRRTGEVDGQIEQVERRLRELRKQFSNFDMMLMAGDLRSLQQNLEKQLTEKTATMNALHGQIAMLDAEERKLTSLFTEQPALQSLHEELERSLTRYTDEHPKVKELRASISALEKESKLRQRTSGPLADLSARREVLRDQLKAAEANESQSRIALRTFATNAIEFTRAQSEFTALAARRDELIQSRAVMVAKGVEIFRPAGQVELSRVTDGARLAGYSFAGIFSGLGFAGVTLAISQRRRRVIRDARALREASGLPVLAELPLLENMDEDAREYWAVETLERLRGATGSERRGAFVCGIISASSGEGRSTWIDLLAKAGLRNGHRVFVISQPLGIASTADSSRPAADEEVSAANSLALFTPSSATPQTIARYSLTTQVSHVQFQQNWERSFSKWQQEENALILVELPPAATADGLLQSRGVPNVLWLGAANIAETRNTLCCVSSLRNTGCNLIGAALNRCPASVRTWIPLSVLGASLAAASAQEANPVAAPITNALSSTKVPLLDRWQEKLTLGPGDVFDVSLYGQGDSFRNGLSIGPDGRFSYLQAMDVMASGLTVDELRAKLEQILGKFHVSPRVVIVPQAFHSKKYFMLGNVAQRGVFTLDRPTTIVEAVAKARGFISGNQHRSSFNLADLSHAFLVRRQANGEFAREPIDFEGLFQRGELQHNRLLAPDDYLYFPPLGLEEVYVLGEVRTTGVTPYVKNLSALGAIASRGGFTEGAFRQRILVVRGSLQKPETFVVDLQSTLRAQSPDFELQPRDIVYVSRKPWAKAQELLEAASSDFVRAIAVTWTGREIGPIIR